MVETHGILNTDCSRYSQDCCLFHDTLYAPVCPSPLSLYLSLHLCTKAYHLCIGEGTNFNMSQKTKQKEQWRGVLLFIPPFVPTCLQDKCVWLNTPQQQTLNLWLRISVLCEICFHNYECVQGWFMRFTFWFHQGSNNVSHILVILHMVLAEYMCIFCLPVCLWTYGTLKRDELPAGLVCRHF